MLFRSTGGPLTIYNGTYGVTVGAGGVIGPTLTVSALGGHSYVTGLTFENVTNYGMPKANTFGGFYAYGGSSRYRPLQELYGSGHGLYAGGANTQIGLPAPNHGNRGSMISFAGTPGVCSGGGGAGATGSNGTFVSCAIHGVNGGTGSSSSITGSSASYEIGRAHV